MQRGLLRDLRILELLAVALEALPEDTADSAGDFRVVFRRDEPALPVGCRWGHLRLQGRVAGGSFGTVYRAFDTQLRTDVALKLPSTGLPSHQLNTRLLEEAGRAARVQHAGVVKMHGTAIRNRRAGMWMELLHGRTLDRILRDEGPLRVSEAARIGCELCSALSAVHAAGLIHGDIKPQNVIREDDGRIVVIDFGSACEISRPTRTQRRITGTPLYLAPEVMSDGAASVASDIYSVGVLLFHLASGDYPVPADSVDELAEAHARRTLRRLKTVRPNLPDEFCQLVDRALNIDAHARYESADQMHSALSRVAAQSGVVNTSRFITPPAHARAVSRSYADRPLSSAAAA